MSAEQPKGGNAWEQFIQYFYKPPYGLLLVWSHRTLDLLRAAWIEDIRREMSRSPDAGCKQETAPVAGDGVPRSLIAERDGYRIARDDAWAKLDAAEAERKKLIAERDELRAKLEASEAERAISSTRWGKLLSERDGLRSQLESSRKDVAALDRLRAELIDERDALRGQLEVARKDLVALGYEVKALDTVRGELVAANDGWRRQVEEKESTLRQQMAHNADRCRERDEARKRLDEVRKAVGQ